MSSQEQQNQNEQFWRREGDEEEDLLNLFTSKAKGYMHAVRENKPNNNTILIYSLLIFISLSLLYFNHSLYQKYSQHQILMETIIKSTINQIKQNKNEVVSKVQYFIKNYTHKYDQINSRYLQSTSAIQAIKERGEHQLDSLQILRDNNTREIISLTKTTMQHQEYVKQIKKYLLSDLQTRTTKNSYFDANHERVRYSNIESIVWVFTQTYATQNQYLKKLYFNNVKYFTYISNFDLRVVTPNNYFYYLSPEMIDKVTQIISKLEIRLSNHDRTNLGDHLQTIKRIIFMVSILYENGGVSIIEDIALTQPLHWIHDIDILQTFNHKDHSIPPQVVGFFNSFYSSSRVNLEEQNYREMYKFPSLQRFFIAAVKRSPLIGLMLEEMIGILQSPFSIKDQIIDDNYNMGWLTGNDPYYQFYYISSHLVLQKKQRELDLNNKNIYAVDYFGLYPLNSALGPNKLKTYFANQTKPYKQNNLLDITKAELENKIGKVKFVHIFNDYWQTNKLMIEIKNRRRNILQNSFIDQIFYPAGTNHGMVYSRIEEYQLRNKFKPWSSLPKKIWIQDISQSSNLVGKMMMNIQAKANQGMEVRSFDSKTIESLLSPQIVKQVNSIFSKSSYSSHPSLKQYILILCLLSKQGGIYFDSSYFLLENLEWLYNINQINGTMIVNRFGEFPEMFMFHNNHLRQSYIYSFDQFHHTRVDSQLIYEKSFIAVGKDSALMDQWIQDILKTLTLPPKQLQNKFNQCGLQNQLQYKSNVEYLPIDILRCLYAKGISHMARQDYLKDTNHYKLWSVDGDYSIFKINANTNYENEEVSKNIYTVKQSQEEVESKIGPIFKMIKLDNANYAYMNEMYVGEGAKQRKSINENSIMSRHFIYKN